MDPVDIVLLMSGKSSWNLLNTMIAVVVNVMLNLLLIPRFGMNGAAVAWAASILLNNLLPLGQTWRFLQLHPFGRGSAIVAASAIGCFGVLASVGREVIGDNFLGLIVSSLVAMPIYLALLWRARRSMHLSAFRDAFRRTPAPADGAIEPTVGDDR